jgi:SM-20-related protein
MELAGGASLALAPHARCPHVIASNVLGASGVEALLDHVARKEAEFKPGATWNRLTKQGQVDANRRDGLVLGDLGPCRDAVAARLWEIAPMALAALHIEERALGSLELEISSYGPGGHFHAHIDTLESRSQVRVLSCVYYFAATPRRFKGGELRLHGFPDRFGQHEAAKVDVAPETDTLVAFPTWMRHEIMPVQLSKDIWLDRRFAINCWVHRATVD